MDTHSFSHTRQRQRHATFETERSRKLGREMVLQPVLLRTALRQPTSDACSFRRSTRTMNKSMTSGCQFRCPGLLVISFLAAARLGHVSRLFQYIWTRMLSIFFLLALFGPTVASKRRKFWKLKSLLR